MPWKKMLAYVTGEVNESLLTRVEYLIEENRVLRNQIGKRILLTDAERRILAEKAVALGKLMADTVTIVKPETILRWHRRLVARKFDGSKSRKKHGRQAAHPAGDRKTDPGYGKGQSFMGLRQDSGCHEESRASDLGPDRRQYPQAQRHRAFRRTGRRTLRGPASSSNTRTCCGQPTSLLQKSGPALV